MTSSPRIAYLTGEYPAVSHTFILREIAALRAQGLMIETCSIRRTGPEHHRGPEERAEAAATFNVLESAKRPKVLASALLGALRSPKRFATALSLAWKMRPPGLRAALYQMFYFVEALVLAQHLRAIGVTHLHNHFAQASCTVALLTAALTDLKFSFTLHGPADFTDPTRWRLDEKIKGASFVACISHYCRSQAMIHVDPAHWEKLKIIHCGVDPDTYTASADRQEAGANILFVGRLAGVKGVPILLAALPHVLAAHPHVQVTLVGDGPERADLERHAMDLGDRVRFVGYQSQEEVRAHLAESDIFVLPSFAEGVPVVLMEAMASGLPVVTTQIAGIPELVEHGVSGKIVAPGDDQALAQAIIEILDDPVVARDMARAGAVKVQAEFSINTEAAKLARLFGDA